MVQHRDAGDLVINRARHVKPSRARGVAGLACLPFRSKKRDFRFVFPIAVTAYATIPDRAEALAVGFQQHLPKPIDPGRLVQAIYDLTDRST